MTRARDNSFNPFNNQYAGKNFLVNGLFDIWQRGTDVTSNTASGTFYATADRWQNWIGTNVNSRYQRIADADPGVSQYSYRIQRVAGVTTSTNYQLSQNIETSISKLLVGKTVTLSFRVKKGANWSDADNTMRASIRYNNNVDGNNINQVVTEIAGVSFSPTASFATYSVTGTVPSSGVSTIMVNFYWEPTGTAGADDWLEFSAVQLEIGSSATSFTRSGGDFQGELFKCHRYYWRETGFQSSGGTQSAFDNNVWFPLQSFNSVPMRSTPTPAIENSPYIMDFQSNLRTITSVNVVTRYAVAFAYSGVKLTTSDSYGINFSDAGRALSFNAEF